MSRSKSINTSMDPDVQLGCVDNADFADERKYIP